MRSPSELLKKALFDYFKPSLPFQKENVQELFDRNKEPVIEAMEEYAKEVAIEFAVFAGKGGSKKDGVFVSHNSQTDNELYELFKHQSL